MLHRQRALIHANGLTRIVSGMPECGPMELADRRAPPWRACSIKRLVSSTGACVVELAVTPRMGDEGLVEEAQSAATAPARPSGSAMVATPLARMPRLEQLRRPKNRWRHRW